MLHLLDVLDHISLRRLFEGDHLIFWSPYILHVLHLSCRRMGAV